MTKLPGKPILPIHPTVDETGQPTVCNCCGRRAWGIGIGKGNGDPQYLCGECVLLVEELRKVRRWDVYELQALDGAVDEMGNYIEERGLTDLQYYDELDQRMLAKSAVVGFIDRLRQLVRDGAAPF
ncbi:hypothetical protein [Rhizobium leguminosarum]|uniref:hypothetical protein n=1 Tax=Rhizobium leguminosarum TaxID=384 RepID=UPI0015DB2744|nr:hypothetical protein [Rhizobium leguminosarum]NZD50522.1 hypothetical protein [Rhizobium leguminosarum]